MVKLFPRQFLLQIRWITGMLQTLTALILLVQEFDTPSCRFVGALMNASIVLQVTFLCEACDELWGLASMFPMVPKDRTNNRVRGNIWTTYSSAIWCKDWLVSNWLCNQPVPIKTKLKTASAQKVTWSTYFTTTLQPAYLTENYLIINHLLTFNEDEMILLNRHWFWKLKYFLQNSSFLPYWSVLTSWTQFLRYSSQMLSDFSDSRLKISLTLFIYPTNLIIYQNLLQWVRVSYAIVYFRSHLIQVI